MQLVDDDTKDVESRVLSIYILGQIGPDAKEAVLTLLSALDDENRIVRQWVPDALRLIDPEAAERAGIQ